MHYTYEEFKQALKTLKILPLSNIEEINKKYKELSKNHHPDLGGDVEEFLKITSAYEIVKDYTSNFRFDFSKEEYYTQNSEERMRSQFGFM